MVREIGSTRRYSGFRFFTGPKEARHDYQTTQIQIASIFGDILGFSPPIYSDLTRRLMFEYVSPSQITVSICGDDGCKTVKYRIQLEDYTDSTRVSLGIIDE